MAESIITLGIGSPAGITEFLLFGLQPGAAVALDTVNWTIVGPDGSWDIAGPEDDWQLVGPDDSWTVMGDAI